MAPQGNSPSGDNDSVSSLKLTAFKKFPANYPHKTHTEWLRAKRIDDDIGPYWRVHDKLYDLTDFVVHHPGGKMWIEVTKGTDITEAFEAAHLTDHPERILKKYYVKDIATPRNSPFTFHEDGFYKTFKRKVQPILKKIGKGPSWKSTLIQDGLGLTFVLLTLACAALGSYLLAVLAGIILAMVAMCSHNYFHQKDNWRMYYFDLSLSSSYQWRVTHALSHHLYTNTAYDIEIAFLEPFWEFLPKPDKSYFQRYGSFVYEVILIPVIPFILYARQALEVFAGTATLAPESFLPLLELLVVAVVSQSFWLALKLFAIIHVSFNYIFVIVGLTASHHHPDIFHDGDRMREDTDWGLCQLDAVRDRKEVTGNLFLVLTSFGEHTLHHLLPTVDHSKLNSLYPAFYETCKEFNVPFKFISWSTLFVGKYLQLANTTPNKNHPGYKQKEI